MLQKEGTITLSIDGLTEIQVNSTFLLRVFMVSSEVTVAEIEAHFEYSSPNHVS